LGLEPLSCLNNNNAVFSVAAVFIVNAVKTSNPTSVNEIALKRAVSVSVKISMQQYAYNNIRKQRDSCSTKDLIRRDELISIQVKNI
jgi:hypothetical protein